MLISQTRSWSSFQPLAFPSLCGPCSLPALNLPFADVGQLSLQANLFLAMSALQNMLRTFQPQVQAPRHPAFGIPRSSFKRPPGGFQFVPPSSPKASPGGGGAKVRALSQSNSVSCGQTSVAMAVNSLTGKKLRDTDIAQKYGFSLLSALNSESRQAGYRWKDGGNFRAQHWKILEKKLNQDHTPVIMGLNGPKFSPSGRGHIVTLLSVEGNKVRYADPADGRIKTTTKQAIQNAPGHPQGKFFFYSTRA